MSLFLLVGVLALAAPGQLKPQFEQSQLLDVVKWYSQKTGKNFIVSDGERERLTIISSRAVPEKEAWGALRLALCDRGLALVDKGAFFRIVRKSRLSNRDFQVRASGEGTWAVTLACKSKQSCSLPALSQHARIVPAFKKGKALGMKIFGIEPGSLYDQFGFRDGDTIIGINDKAVTSPEQALARFQEHKDADRIKVDFLRRGIELSNTYLINRAVVDRKTAD